MINCISVHSPCREHAYRPERISCLAVSLSISGRCSGQVKPDWQSFRSPGGEVERLAWRLGLTRHQRGLKLLKLLHSGLLQRRGPARQVAGALRSRPIGRTEARSHTKVMRLVCSWLYNDLWSFSHGPLKRSLRVAKG